MVASLFFHWAQISSICAWSNILIWCQYLAGKLEPIQSILSLDPICGKITKLVTDEEVATLKESEQLLKHNNFILLIVTDIQSLDN